MGLATSTCRVRLQQGTERATVVLPFKVVYGIDSLGPLVPRPLDQRPSADADQRVEETKKLYEHVRDRIEKIIRPI